MRKPPHKTRSEIADEIEAYTKDNPFEGIDVLSMTEIVRDYWSQIVDALREGAASPDEPGQ